MKRSEREAEMASMRGSSITPVQQESIIISVREISNRLADVRDKVRNMKADVMGEEEQNKTSPIVANNLYSLVSGIFPTLAEIEDDLARVMNRLGVTTGLPKSEVVGKLQRGA